MLIRTPSRLLAFNGRTQLLVRFTKILRLSSWLFWSRTIWTITKWTTLCLSTCLKSRCKANSIRFPSRTLANVQEFKNSMRGIERLHPTNLFWFRCYEDLNNRMRSFPTLNQQKLKQLSEQRRLKRWKKKKRKTLRVLKAHLTRRINMVLPRHQRLLATTRSRRTSSRTSKISNYCQTLREIPSALVVELPAHPQLVLTRALTHLTWVNSTTLKKWKSHREND